MSKKSFLKQFLKEYHWLVIGAFWIIAYVLGYIGSIKQFAATAEERSFWDPFYRPLQLFLLDDSMVILGPVVSWELEVARFLAPAVAAYTALVALLTLFRDQIKIFRLRFVRGHTVICGLGQKGLQLIRDFNNHGDQVVVIEVDEDNDEISSCRELGIPILIGDATDELLLRKAGVHCAGYVVAITGDDGTNIEIAMITHRLVEKRKASLVGVVQCFVHIVDFKLCTLLGRHRIFTNTEDACEVSVFNIYENSARVMLREHPLDLGGISTEDLRNVHLVVAGFGQMGESIVLQAARVAHFANGKKLRITVIDKLADQKMKSFYGRYSQFDKACEITFIKGDVEDAEILDKMCQWADDDKYITTEVVTIDNDAQSLSCALNIISRSHHNTIPIVVRITEDNGLGMLIERDGQKSDWLNYVYPFGMIGLVCTREILVNEKLNSLAKAIHAEFVNKAKAEGRPENDVSIRPWEQLDPDLKNSNLQQADHIPVKLRAIGCYSSRPEAGKKPVTAFTDEEIELMAKMEHARWNSERFLAGWTVGPKNIEKKTSPYLVPWEELSEDIKEYDRNTVRKIPHQLGLIGEVIYQESDTNSVDSKR